MKLIGTMGRDFDLHRFQTLAEARRIIGEFITRYNTEWLIERLGHQTPMAARIAAMAG
jgi:transposase InsO family protein